MTLKSKFKELKKVDITKMDVSLAIVKEYKKDRESRYPISYVKIDQKLEKRLKSIMKQRIGEAKTVEEYAFDCPEPEEDQVRAIRYQETDFFKIHENLTELNPEEDVIENVAELFKAKSYLIILRDSEGIKLIGFKTLPENWKMKKNKGLIPLLFKEDRFEDLENENVFSISGTIDLFYYDEALFILSKNNFEAGLNFREGMMKKADDLYTEVQELELFENLQILKNRIGNNQRYLRKIAMIKNLGYYNDQEYLGKLENVSFRKNWGIEFNDGKIVITEENLDHILVVLQNKRLLSEVTEETFDVESVKKFNV